MACRGCLYGLTEEEVQRLLAMPEADRPVFLNNDIWEEGFDTDNYFQELDKAWDALHRCLGEFPPETPYFYDPGPSEVAWADPYKFGSEPLRSAVLCGQRIFSPDNQYFVRLVDPTMVKAVAREFKAVSREALAQRYWHHCQGAWPEYGEEDLEYTWEYFELMRDFYERMAGQGKAVVFIADQ